MRVIPIPVLQDNYAYLWVKSAALFVLEHIALYIISLIGFLTLQGNG